MEKITQCTSCFCYIKRNTQLLPLLKHLVFCMNALSDKGYRRFYANFSRTIMKQYINPHYCESLRLLPTCYSTGTLFYFYQNDKKQFFCIFNYHLEMHYESSISIASISKIYSRWFIPGGKINKRCRKRT